MALDDDLARALADGNIILCVGSEPSIAAGLPDLDGLARTLLAHAIAIDASVEQLALNTWIAQGRAPELLEQLHHRLGPEFQREVERALSDQGRPLPPVVRAIAALRKQLRAIYTTRLDRLIERGLAGRWPSFHGGRADVAQRRSVVFKIRGTLEFPQSWVLTREQEEREFASGTLRRSVLEAAFRAHQLLFIGFAVQGHELRRLLDLLPSQTEGQSPAHFIALPECSGPEREQLERRGLRVLTVETEALLAELGGRVEYEYKPPPSLEQCPYPGLESFREDQAALFFGRHAEVSQATALLGDVGGVDNRWLAIEGPSGVGKSSFARAGVVPALRQGFAAGTPVRWRVATLRPGSRPIASLAEALASELGQDAKLLREQIKADPRRLTELARTTLSPGEGLLVLVDQLEEMVTLAPEVERKPFDEALARALDARAIYLVTTARSDLIPALQRGLPALAGLLNDVAERYVLPPISRTGLREAICEPAAKMGVTIAPELVERILVEADVRPVQTSDGETRTTDAALPLVAHVLCGLWTCETIADGVITLDEYLALGGIAGALSRSADGLVDSLGARAQASVRKLLLGMIRLQPDGTATRRVLDLAEAKELASDAVIARLSGAGGKQSPSARLLVVRDEEGHHEVELVHEALIRDWAKLHAWIEEDRTRLLLDEDLARQAEKWESRGRPNDELPWGRDAIELLQARPRGVNRVQQREFKRALHQALRRRRLIAMGIGVVTALGGLAIAALIFVLNEGKMDDTTGAPIIAVPPPDSVSNSPPFPVTVAPQAPAPARPAAPPPLTVADCDGLVGKWTYSTSVDEAISDAKWIGGKYELVLERGTSEWNGICTMNASLRKLGAARSGEGKSKIEVVAKRIPTGIEINDNFHLVEKRCHGECKCRFKFMFNGENVTGDFIYQNGNLTGLLMGGRGAASKSEPKPPRGKPKGHIPEQAPLPEQVPRPEQVPLPEQAPLPEQVPRPGNGRHNPNSHSPWKK